MSIFRLNQEFGMFSESSLGLELMPGMVAVIQTFGDRINFHPLKSLTWSFLV